MIEILDRSEGSVVGLGVSGKLTADDYERVLPELERRIEEHGEIALLCRFEDWGGIEPEAVWRDLDFSTRYLGSFRRIAVLPDRGWQATLARTIGPLLGVEARAFERANEDAAWDWLLRRAEDDRSWSGEDAARRHAGRYQRRVEDLARDLREDAGRLESEAGRALFRSAADVLGAVASSLRRQARAGGADERSGAGGGKPSREEGPDQPGEDDGAEPGGDQSGAG